jgi:hypothetical protein
MTMNAKSSVCTAGAGGATAQNASRQLEKCSASLGTRAVVEGQTVPWYFHLCQYKAGAAVTVLRMKIRQSNCSVVLEGGRALNHMVQGRTLQTSGEMRTAAVFNRAKWSWQIAR